MNYWQASEIGARNPSLGFVKWVSPTTRGPHEHLFVFVNGSLGPFFEAVVAEPKRHVSVKKNGGRLKTMGEHDGADHEPSIKRA